MPYNYLNDSMGIEFLEASDYKICDQELVCDVNATICGKCYKDPDSFSGKLYEHMSQYFLFNENSLEKKRKGMYLTYDNEYEHEMSTDYIGPSRYWTLKFLEGDNIYKAGIIGDFLLVCRTIGGHVFWPAHQVGRAKTINQIRGGNRIYDRFDVTLAELKYYFETQIESKSQDIIDPFFIDKDLYDAFDRYKWFFEKYENFSTYIESMKLEMFLKDGKVISLTDSDIEHENIVFIDKNNNISLSEKNIENYINNCKELIKERTKIIEDSKK